MTISKRTSITLIVLACGLICILIEVGGFMIFENYCKNYYTKGKPFRSVVTQLNELSRDSNKAKKVSGASEK